MRFSQFFSLSIRWGLGFLFISIFSIRTISLAGDNPTYLFLRNDVSARAAALGGGLLTAPNDINAMFYNPATLATETTSTASFGFFKHLLDVNAGHASYGQEIPDVGFVGGGVVFTNYGSITKTDENGIRGDQFSPLDLAINAGIATKIDISSTMGGNLFLGGNIKFISSSIGDYSSSAVAFDLGSLYQLPNKRTAFALTLNNLGTQLSSYYNTREPLPFDIKFSISHKPERLPVNLNLTFHRLNAEGDFSDKVRAFSIGGEFKVGQYVRARFGYNNQRRQDLKLSSGVGLAGFSLGFGIVYDVYTFDYANVMYGVVGSLNLFSIGMQI